MLTALFPPFKGSVPTCLTTRNPALGRGPQRKSSCTACDAFEPLQGSPSSLPEIRVHRKARRLLQRMLSRVLGKEAGCSSTATHIIFEQRPNPAARQGRCDSAPKSQVGTPRLAEVKQLVSSKVAQGVLGPKICVH